MLLPILMGQHLVKSGSIAAGDNKLDYTNNAFIEFGVDISAYHGNHKIVVTDSASKSATGYLHSVAPGGVAYGAEILTDGDMETDPTTNWNYQLAGLTLAEEGVIIHGGSKALKLTNTEDGWGNTGQKNGLVAGAVGKITGNMRAGASSSCDFYVQSDNYAILVTSALVTNSSAYEEKNVYFTSRDGTIRIRLRCKTSLTGREAYFDDFSFARMTDCAATGSLIVSTLGGSTRSWTNVDAGFNPNLACTYKIYRVR